MFTRITLAGAAAACLLLSPSAHAQAPGVWGDRAPFGSVTVSADRRHIEVCDLQADGHGVKVEYATSMLLTHTVTDPNGAKRGCGTDRVWMGRIDVFKLCETGFASSGCNASIWINKR
ncbi:hypothetical protein [Nonomuraea sp. NPDC023979]|uniref:hypothetical protein n=1 Tax=Nonomuraea sp. NPDC023979 TaxID=3154796 RepID=UPI00340A6722